MKPEEATRSSTNSLVIGRHQSHDAKFSKVLGGRKQPIRALWVRNGRFYAQLKIENPVIGLKKTRRVVLKGALADGLIQRLPTEGLRPLKTTTRKRLLFTSQDLENLCASALGNREDKNGATVPATENAEQFIEYVKFMAYCGARRNEALAVRWQDVDFKQCQLTVGADSDIKNRSSRVVDFNPKLKAHLLNMKKRKAPDSEWLFPSPQRGEKDIPAKTFRESLVLVRTKAKQPGFVFHDCRHHFISMCVMSGVDFMTIAAWVGHRDGGVLIGKVYGHLANEHRKAMAGRVNFGPTLVNLAAND